MATANINETLIQGAMEGFKQFIAPITSFSYVVKPGGAALNDTVIVPFASANSGSNAFAYSTGYATEDSSVVGKSCTMGTLLYKKINLTDSDLAKLNPEVLTRLGRQQGARLAADFVSASFASCATATNFPYSSSAVATNLTASAGLAALDKVANDYKWPDGERYLICSTTAWQSLMTNTTVVAANSFGSAEPIQQGKLSSVLGFVPFKVNFTLPNSATAIAVNPNAMVVGNAYHAPVDAGANYISAQEIIDEDTGLTIGFRQYYDPAKATSVRVFDILGGCGAADATALSWIK
jgi:hypothetical protein